MENVTNAAAQGTAPHNSRPETSVDNMFLATMRRVLPWIFMIPLKTHDIFVIDLGDGTGCNSAWMGCYNNVELAAVIDVAVKYLIENLKSLCQHFTLISKLLVKMLPWQEIIRRGNTTGGT